MTETFATVLARQLEDKNNGMIDNTPQPPHSATQSSLGKKQTVLKTDLTNRIQTKTLDTASMTLDTILPGNQPAGMACHDVGATPGAGNQDDSPSAIPPDASSMAQAAGLFGAMRIQPAITDKGDSDANVAACQTREAPAHRTQASFAREKTKQLTASSVRMDTPITEQPILKSPAAAEPFKMATSVSGMPPPTSAQTLAQSASTLIASSIQPNISINTNQTHIAAPLGSSAWPDEFSQTVSWISTRQNQIAELHLNPPELGPMSVTLTINDNQATALFSSPHSAVRDAIENALPKLRESLADNGIMLGNATVNDQAPRDSGAGNFANQHPHTRTDSVHTARTEPTSSPAMVTRRHNGMVDTFA